MRTIKKSIIKGKTNSLKMFKGKAALELLLNNQAVIECKLNLLKTIYISKKTLKPDMMFYIDEHSNFASFDLNELSIDKVIRLLFNDCDKMSSSCNVYLEIIYRKIIVSLSKIIQGK